VILLELEQEAKMHQQFPLSNNDYMHIEAGKEEGIRDLEEKARRHYPLIN
jgi:hypothetical protein